jgi:hypothetical protein
MDGLAVMIFAGDGTIVGELLIGGGVGERILTVLTSRQTTDCSGREVGFCGA